MKITVKCHLTSSSCNWFVQVIHHHILQSLMFSGQPQEEKRTIKAKLTQKEWTESEKNNKEELFYTI